jgi:hypothetical protein
MTSDKTLPPESVIERARTRPGTWIYEIVGEYSEDDAIPPEAIKGAWKVDEDGRLTGDYLPNENFGTTESGLS